MGRTVFCKPGFEKTKEKQSGVTIRASKIEKPKEKIKTITIHSLKKLYGSTLRHQ